MCAATYTTHILVQMGNRQAAKEKTRRAGHDVSTGEANHRRNVPCSFLRAAPPSTRQSIFAHAAITVEMEESARDETRGQRERERLLGLCVGVCVCVWEHVCAALGAHGARRTRTHERAARERSRCEAETGTRSPSALSRWHEFRFLLRSPSYCSRRSWGGVFPVPEFPTWHGISRNRMSMIFRHQASTKRMKPNPKSKRVLTLGQNLPSSV